MVKTNKKSLVALVVMAFLLVASIVMAATGAWFTASDNASGSEDIQFGKVAIDVAEWDDTDGWSNLGLTDGAENLHAMPGSIYTGKFVISNAGDEDVYYKVTAISVKVSYEGADVTNVLSSYITIDGDDTSAAPVLLKVSDTKDVAITVTISEELPNEVPNGEGKIVCNGGELSLSFDITVEAVQAANNTDGANGWA